MNLDAVTEDRSNRRLPTVLHDDRDEVNGPPHPRHRAQGRQSSPSRSHTLRHAFITAALDAGVALRDVQEAASHADPRTTMRCDRARASLDRHATYIVATFIKQPDRPRDRGSRSVQ
jgi:integrase